MKPVISIGNQNFKSIREKRAFYVDKTFFIRDWWEKEDVVTLITRPRRFGKTLNMSMVEQFFSIEYAGRGDLFAGLSIWENEKYKKLQGTWPVLFLSFADIKSTTYEMARMAVIRKLVRLYSEHEFLRDCGCLNDRDREYFDSVREDMSDDVAAVALNYLSDYMSRYYGKKVLILLDEYDTPLQEAYVCGYWEALTGFIRSLFNSTFKTNPYLERGLLTGITRISKESIFSDLNNLEVVTTISCKYETAYGFTKEEVEKVLEQFGMEQNKEKVARWYDGFRFGDQKDIYNPWSITKYLDAGKLDSYWSNTSSNLLVGKLIREGNADLKTDMERLLKGESIRTRLDEEIVFDQLEQSNRAIWSLLLASGYLKVGRTPKEGEDEPYEVSLTNYEVQRMFRRLIQDWFAAPQVRYHEFVQALLSDDVGYMNQYMNQMATELFSSFDTGKAPSEKGQPERFYHGFVLGLIADAQIPYEVTSNRESGLGRYDVMLRPKQKGDKAYVLEFKVINPYKEKSLEEAVQSALKQIQEKNYDAQLKAAGISADRIRHYGFAFDGKRVLIDGGPAQ